MRGSAATTTSLLGDGEAIAAVLRRIVPGCHVVAMERLGVDAADADVARKAQGYGAATRVTIADRAGRCRAVVFRTSGADEFGHDRRADRAANLLLAWDTFGEIPGGVAVLDVGFAAPDRLVSLRDAGEAYLVTEWAEGSPYADDLRRIAREGAAAALDLARAEALARWLVALHAAPLDEPVAWRRALRDLVGHGEGIFGIVDAYGPGVPAAPPERLLRLEHRCLDWRARLRPRAERLRRTHGDFHPFNVLFAGGTAFTALDASRGGRGDPADDVVALSVNYPYFALQAPAAWPRGLGALWDRFWEVYLRGAGPSVLEAVPPFLAWRALVVCCPRFYPGLAPAARDALLGWAEAALDGGTFDPASAGRLFR